MLAILRDSPLDAFRPSSLEKGIPAHRWEKYVVPEGMRIDEMERDSRGRLLGEVPGDGNVFDHQIEQERLIGTYGIFDIESEALVNAGYVKLRPISRMDFFSLRVAALVHDLGEIEHGDVVFDDKHTAKHTAQDEIAATRKFVRKALDERASRRNREDPSEITREDPRRKRRLERNVMNSYAIDHDRSHRLHAIFKLYEKYSYISGAIAIYGEGKGTIAHPHYAVHNVLKNQIGALMAAEEAEIQSAVLFLLENGRTITDMFNWVVASGFRDENAQYQAAFERAEALWKGRMEKIQSWCVEMGIPEIA